ncbi:gamma-tubulin complex component 5 [Notothenia coriiceps]|uniref:Gamma-tubulin complex component 5 n=1 Tax=Notothenia coriiceps TaxID=8208 RepID=A0A6I9PXQ4_9TELE|nr:PREDICTED: gamma-tubulin complex component 5 [Notothenia coriiceps]
MAHWTTFEKETERETKRLVACISGVEDEEDQNFQLALKFAWSNFRFHRFLDVDSHKVQRSISGIYEKLMVHSDVVKAESWTKLTEEFLNSPLPNTDGVKSDAHYSLVSLLLFLSESPLHTNFTERPRIKEAEAKDDFDWAKYLREDEDIDDGPYPDTPEWSEEESEDEDSQQPISREDSGIQLDRTPQEDQDNNNKTVPVTWTVSVVVVAESPDVAYQTGCVLIGDHAGISERNRPSLASRCNYRSYALVENVSTACYKIQYDTVVSRTS